MLTVLFISAKIINIIALSIGMIGSFVVYRYSPKISSKTYIYLREEQEKIMQKDKRKNQMATFGMFLIFVSFMLQLVAILF